VLRPTPEDRVLVFDFQQAPTPSAFTSGGASGTGAGADTGADADTDTERASLTAELLALTLSCFRARGVSSPPDGAPTRLASWQSGAPRAVCLWDASAAEPLPSTFASPLIRGGAPPWSLAEATHQSGPHVPAGQGRSDVPGSRQPPQPPPGPGIPRVPPPSCGMPLLEPLWEAPGGRSAGAVGDSHLGGRHGRREYVLKGSARCRSLGGRPAETA